MNTKPIIRLLTEKDTAIYRNLRLKSYQESPFSFSESYEDEVKKAEQEFCDELIISGNPAEWFVLGAFSEAQNLVGFVKFRRDKRVKARHKAMIHAMYVDPHHRGLGIARQLIVTVLERAKQLPELEQIHLWALYSENSAAAGFYKTCGFESQGTVVKNDLKVNGKYVDAEYMVMYL